MPQQPAATASSQPAQLDDCQASSALGWVGFQAISVRPARERQFNQDHRVQTDKLLSTTRRIGTGFAFVIFPVVFVFAFSVHPGLLNPHLLGPSELILRARGDSLLQFAHALVTLNTALLVVVALHFMKRLERSSGALAGFVGAALAVLGSLALAADKGALCLTMSALDGLSDAEFAGMMPGLLAMFSKRGWLVLLWGIVLLPLGFGI